MIGKTFVIAEAGSNHNGEFDTAKKLIDVAKISGADAVKFQSFKADKLFSTRSKKVNNHDVFKLFKPMEVSNMWLKDVAAYCLERDIEFMCTPFDEDAVDFLYELGVKRIKGSGSLFCHRAR
jgi:sialic acid synthase SpsE